MRLLVPLLLLGLAAGCLQQAKVMPEPDLRTPAVEVLRQLPGVAEVEVLVPAAQPTHRIIHLRDYHFVPRDLFALDVRQAAGKLAVDELYRQHLLDVEQVAVEQATILRSLVKHHRLRRVLAEGLTAEGLPAYQEVIAAFRDTEERLALLKKERAQVRREAPDLDRGIDEVVRAHHQELLKYGAAGELAVAGDIEVGFAPQSEARDRGGRSPD
jgi:hypothetical protein